MARSHVRWQFGVWRKPEHRDTPKDARLLYMTILADEALNQAGVVVLRLPVWAEDAGMTDDETEAALKELQARRFVVVDHRNCELLVRTFIRNDHVDQQPNVLRNALALAELVRSDEIRRVLATELRKLPAPLPPKKLANGRTFIYPDPHATANRIDPDGPQPDHREPVDNPGQNPSRNPSANPSAGTLPRTLGGGGRGRGSGTGTAHGSVESAPRPAQPRVDEPPATLPGLLVGVPAPPPEAPGCRVHRNVPPEQRPRCPGCQKSREQWERDVAERRTAEASARARIRETCSAPGCEDGWIEHPPDDEHGPALTRCACNPPPDVGLRAV